MYLAQKARNVLRGLLQAHGSTYVKSHLWNKEFSQGSWDCLDNTAADCVYPLVEKYANKGSILDLGCGSGSTGNELTITTYRDYTGVDISDVAIGKAIKRTETCGPSGKNHYFQSDIIGYVPTQQFDVILFRDSIYYVPKAKIKAMLDRYSKYLKEHGVFIVRMWDVTGKHKPIVGNIVKNFQVLEKYSPAEQPKTAVIVFRPS